MTRAAAWLVLAACASAPHRAEPVGVTAALPTEPVPAEASRPARTDDPIVRRALLRMSVLRSLSIERPVAGVLLSRSELMAKLEQHVASGYPRHAIASEEQFAKLLGAIGRSVDYERATFALIDEQIGGFYEPSDETLYLPSDLDSRSGAFALVHEAVHALQDQHFDLKKRERYVEGASDAMLAQGCLAEGDATSAMADFMLEDEGRTAIDVPDSTLSHLVDEKSSVPAYVQRSVFAPYVEGTRFVNALRRKGGWDEVNRAWTQPLTTEQVLHEDKWAAQEPALDVPAPTFSGLDAAYGFVEIDQKGELGVRLVFESWTSKDEATRAASHWGGDRSALAKDGARAALAWRIRYDEAPSPDREAYARGAFEILTRAALGGAAAKTFACAARAPSAMAIARKGRDLLVLVAPSECAALERWSAAVLSN